MLIFMALPMAWPSHIPAIKRKKGNLDINAGYQAGHSSVAPQLSSNTL